MTDLAKLKVMKPLAEDHALIVWHAGLDEGKYVVQVVRTDEYHATLYIFENGQVKFEPCLSG